MSSEEELNSQVRKPKKNLKNPLDKLHRVWYNKNVIKGRNQ